MTIKTLAERGTTACSIAQMLGVTEGAVRDHLKRQAAAAHDGRAQQTHLASQRDTTISTWMAGRGEGAAHGSDLLPGRAMDGSDTPMRDG